MTASSKRSIIGAALKSASLAFALGITSGPGCAATQPATPCNRPEGWLCSCSTRDNYEDPDGPFTDGRYAEAPTQAARIKVVSFNIKFSRDIPGAIEALEHADLRGADVVLLQEMTANGTERIARALSYDYVYYPASRHLDCIDFGNAVLSRWPITAHRKIALPHPSPNGQRRIAVRATLDIAGRGTTVYSVHTETERLPWKQRRMQFARVAGDYGTTTDRVIVGGDFNSNRRAKRQMDIVFRRSGLIRVSADIATCTFIGLLILKLDHIYAKGFVPVAAGRVPTGASDHLPIWVDLVPVR